MLRETRAACHSIESYRVRFQDCDPSGRIHLHRLMDYAQDCDDKNCRMLGVDSRSLRSKNAVWIIIGYDFHFTAPLPASGDLLIIETWSGGLDGLRFYRENRYYRGSHAGKNLIGKSVSEWILARADDHRPIRPATILDPDEFNDMSDPGVAGMEKFERLNPAIDPLTAPCHFQYRAGFSDLDLNTHLHNTHYVRLAVDAAVRLLKLDPLRQHLQIKTFQIQYKAEVNHDDLLLVAADFDSEPSGIRIQGRLEGGQEVSFLAKLTCETGDPDLWQKGDPDEGPDH